MAHASLPFLTVLSAALVRSPPTRGSRSQRAAWPTPRAVAEAAHNCMCAFRCGAASQDKEATDVGQPGQPLCDPFPELVVPSGRNTPRGPRRVASAVLYATSHTLSVPEHRQAATGARDGTVPPALVRARRANASLGALGGSPSPAPSASAALSAAVEGAPPAPAPEDSAVSVPQEESLTPAAAPTVSPLAPASIAAAASAVGQVQPWEDGVQLAMGGFCPVTLCTRAGLPCAASRDVGTVVYLNKVYGFVDAAAVRAFAAAPEAFLQARHPFAQARPTEGCLLVSAPRASRPRSVRRTSRISAPNWSTSCT